MYISIGSRAAAFEVHTNFHVASPSSQETKGIIVEDPVESSIDGKRDLLSVKVPHFGVVSLQSRSKHKRCTSEQSRLSSLNM